MSLKVTPANPMFTTVLKSTLGRYVVYKNRVEFAREDLSRWHAIQPPYLILANHVNNLDPFWLGYFSKDPIHFVVSDEQYRNPVKRFFLRNLLGGIPKTKFISDMDTIKGILRLVKSGHAIGIFPEGMRTWDGRTGDIIESTSKLVKLLKIPVIACTLDGAHLAHPRWAINGRRGRVTIRIQDIMDGETLKGMDVPAIHKWLTHALDHDEYAAQLSEPIRYKGEKLAEKLERFLFACPHCDSITTLHSENNLLYCSECHYAVTYNEFGGFEPHTHELIFSNPRDWNTWQRDFLKLRLETRPEKEVIFSDHAMLYSADKQKPLEKRTDGVLTLTPEEIYFSESGTSLHFPFRHIAGMNVQYSNELEFYFKDTLYRFKFSDSGASAYKWTAALELKAASLPIKNTMINA